MYTIGFNCLISRQTGHVVLGLTGSVQFQSCRSRPLSIAVCSRDIFPGSAPRRGPAETEFVPARPQHCGASFRIPTLPAYCLTTCHTTFSVISVPQIVPILHTQRNNRPLSILDAASQSSTVPLTHERTGIVRTWPPFPIKSTMAQ